MSFAAINHLFEGLQSQQATLVCIYGLYVEVAAAVYVRGGHFAATESELP